MGNNGSNGQRLVEQMDTLIDYARQFASNESQGKTVYNDSNTMHRWIKLRNQRELIGLSRYNHFLYEQCSQKTEDRCDCGDNHKGISFYHDDQIVEYNMCPRTWWIKLVNLAMEKGIGNGDKFVAQTPITKFVRLYEHQQPS